MEQLQHFLASPWATLFSLTVGVFGLIAAYIFFKRSVSRKDPCWTVRNNTLIEGHSAKFDDLAVSYRGAPVKDLSVARVLFWNAGGATLDRIDLVPADPLRISIRDGAQILDVQILASNNMANRFSAEISPNGDAARLAFEYLDRGHGAVIQVVHTGTNSDDLQIEGALKGVAKARKRQLRSVRYLPLPTTGAFDRSLRPLTRRRIMVGMMLAFVAASLGLAYVRAMKPLHEPNSRTAVGLLLGYAAAGLVFAILALRSRPPRGLEAYEE